MKKQTVAGLTLIQDPTSKSLSFRAQNGNSTVSQVHLEWMRQESAKRGNCDLRICLHRNRTALLHDMIVLHHRNNYYQPHLHRTKDEVYHWITGEFALLRFMNDGSFQNCDVLSKSRNVVLRIEKNQWHTVVVLSKTAIFHEIRPGPFSPGEDSVFAPWASEPSDKNKSEAYHQRLIKEASENVPYSK